MCRSPLAPLQVLLGGGAALVVARWHLAKVVQKQGAAAVPWLLRSMLRLGGGSNQQQLSTFLSIPVRLAAVAASSYLSCNVPVLSGRAHQVRLAGAKWEEVPLSGRCRPATEPLSEQEKAVRASWEAQYSDAMARNFSGAHAGTEPPTAARRVFCA